MKHIVVLMQENRSFDHYFGTLRGVRGFGDPRAATLSSGNSVFQQPHGSGTLLPNHPPEPLMGYQFIGDLAHSWSDQHAAWNNGNNDGWSRPRAPRPWSMSIGPTSRSTTRWLTPSPFATITIARSWGRPIPTATICGPLGRPERLDPGHAGGPVLRLDARQFRTGGWAEHRQRRAARRSRRQQ
ncbi:MAG: alkaline phosphatase family protein [Aliidongia sp.]